MSERYELEELVLDEMSLVTNDGQPRNQHSDAVLAKARAKNESGTMEENRTERLGLWKSLGIALGLTSQVKKMEAHGVSTTDNGTPAAPDSQQKAGDEIEALKAQVAELKKSNDELVAKAKKMDDEKKKMEEEEEGFVKSLDPTLRTVYEGMNSEQKAAYRQAVTKASTGDTTASQLAKAIEATGQQKAQIASLQKAEEIRKAEVEFAELDKAAISVPEFASHMVEARKAAPEAAKYFGEKFKALTEQARVAGLYSEFGHQHKGGDSEASAEAKLDKAAKEIAKAEKIPYAQAYVKAIDSNPDLMKQHQAELRGATS